MSKVRCGVVGVGGIGAKHVGWIDGTGNMETIAVCDTNPEVKAKIAETFPKLSFYSSLGEMLSNEKLDFVVIASPHHLHRELTIQALDGGVDVMVEKPMATRYEDCVAMIEASKRNGKMLTVFHNRRLDPWFTAAKEAIDAGKLGDLVELRAMYLNPPGKTSRSWRAFKETSGGLMYDWGAHLIDYILHFADSPVVSVSGHIVRLPEIDPELNEDHGHITIRFASGVIGHVIMSDIDREPKYRYTLVGTKGTLVDHWNWSGGAVKIYTGEGRDPFAVEEIEYAAESAAFANYYARLADHYKNGTPIMVTPESAALIIRILNASEVSSANGGVPVVFD